MNRATPLPLVIPEGAGLCQLPFRVWLIFCLGSSAGFGRAKVRVGVKDRPEADRGAAVVLDANPAWHMLALAEKLRVVVCCCSMAGSPVVDIASLRCQSFLRRAGRHGVRCDSTAGGVNQKGTTTPRVGVMTSTTRADCDALVIMPPGAAGTGVARCDRVGHRRPSRPIPGRRRR
jgi:hypothetical protein